MSRPGAGLSRAAPWGPWLLWALVSLLLCAQPWMGLYAFSRWLTLVFFFGLCSAAASAGWSRRWFWGLAACAPILAAAGFFLRNPEGRMTGLLPPYYNYTMFVEAAFFACSAAALGHPDGPRGRARVLLWAGMSLALAVILLSASRGAMAAVAVSTLAWAASRGRLTRRVCLGIALAAAALSLLAPASFWFHVLKLDMAKWFTRPQIWTAAWRTAADHPWFGEGLGNFAVGFLRHNFPKGWASNYGFFADHAHSEPLELAAETGWPGLVLFAAALALSLKPRRNDFAREGALFACLAMSVFGLFDNMLQLPALGLLFFSALACSAGQAPEPGREPFPRAWLWACALGLGLSVTAAAPRALLDAYWRRSAEEERPAERIKWLARLESLSPADDALHASRARAWLELGEEAGALEAIELARRFSPTNAFHPQLQAEISFAARRWPRALELADRAIELEPNFLAARLLRARTLRELGRAQAASAELAELRRRQAALKPLTLYTNYDRGLAAVDGAGLERLEEGLSKYK